MRRASDAPRTPDAARTPERLRLPAPFPTGPRLHLRGSLRASRAGLVPAVILLLLAALACSDSTGPDIGPCEVIYITSQSDPGATTGIQVENRLPGGLQATVESDRYVSTTADMGPGACEVWGYPAGSYTVALQRCEQDVPGSTECTGLTGAVVRRSVLVESGSRARLRVDTSFFD